MSAEGHDELCYYCKKPCNSFAANPGKWPILLDHPDEPGVVKYHHLDCVSSRLEKWRKALEFIQQVGCKQYKDEEEFWCKHDGSAHSCYCPAGIAKKALEL